MLHSAGFADDQDLVDRDADRWRTRRSRGCAYFRAFFLAFFLATFFLATFFFAAFFFLAISITSFLYGGYYRRSKRFVKKFFHNGKNFRLILIGGMFLHAISSLFLSIVILSGHTSLYFIDAKRVECVARRI
jgi:hypothetical protein